MQTKEQKWGRPGNSYPLIATQAYLHLPRTIISLAETGIEDSEGSEQGVKGGKGVRRGERGEMQKGGEGRERMENRE